MPARTPKPLRPAGFRALSFPELPDQLGLPPVRAPYWEPLFSACQETGTVVCLHAGSGGTLFATSEGAPRETTAAFFGLSAVIPAIDWLFALVPVRFPELKLAYSEGQIGWIPYALERADNTWKYHSSWTDSDETVPEPPSTYYKGRVFGCFTNDVHGVESIEQVGEDNVCFETDYPHTDTTWPFVQREVERMTAALTDEQRYKVLRGNAIRMLDLDRT